jgi:hypothetical protein
LPHREGRRRSPKSIRRRRSRLAGVGGVRAGIAGVYRRDRRPCRTALGRPTAAQTSSTSGTPSPSPSSPRFVTQAEGLVRAPPVPEPRVPPPTGVASLRRGNRTRRRAPGPSRR